MAIARTAARISATFVAVSAAAAQVAGVPDAPRPGPLPFAALIVDNDMLGAEIGDNGDDFRTNAVTAQLKIDRWVAVVDHSMLTHKFDAPPAGRCDELTATLSWLAWPDGADAADDRPWLAIGVGARVDGNLGGGWVQNHWHDANKFAELHLPYDGGGGEAVVCVAGEWELLGPVRVPMAWLDGGDGDFGVSIGTKAIAGTAGEAQGDVQARLVAAGVDGAAWLGARQRWQVGDPISASAGVVERHEAGTWAQWGLSTGGWFVQAEYHFRERDGTGSLGWEWQRPAGRDLGGAAPGQVEGSLGYYLGGSEGAQLRWRPHWLRDLVGERAQAFVDYRFGRAPHVDWRDDAVIYRQPTAGFEVAAFPAHRGFWCTPFASAALGVRHERVAVIGEDPRFQPVSHASGVALGGVGVRFAWNGRPRAGETASYGACAAYEAWLPFRHAEAVSGADEARMLGFNHGLGIRLYTNVEW